jgi:hypothetical protein
MSLFLGFGREHLEWNYEKTGNPVYLHIVQRQKPEVDRPLKKPTLLARGMCSFFYYYWREGAHIYLTRCSGLYRI